MAFKEITFANSMNINKRDELFAYLRYGCFRSHSPGLYPNHQFTVAGTLANPNVIATGFGCVLTENGLNRDLYELPNPVATNTNEFVRGVAIAEANGQKYVINQFGLIWEIPGGGAVADALGDIATGTDATSNGNPGLTLFDGVHVYVLLSSKIYRFLPGQNTYTAQGPVFTGVPDNILGWDEYEDEIFLYAQEGQDVRTFIWDKTDPTVFRKRKRIRNAQFLAGGTINDYPTIVVARGLDQNPKEEDSIMEVRRWSGTGWRDLNAIKVVDQPNYLAHAIDDDSLVLSFQGSGNNQPDLFQDYVYRVYWDGSIEVIYNSGPQGANNEIETIDIDYGEVRMIHQNGEIVEHQDIQTTYNTYTDYDDTIYITNFLNNPYNKHKLDSFGMSFEKLTANQRIVVSYRVSDRDDWTQMADIDEDTVKDFVNHNKDARDDRDQIIYISKIQGLVDPDNRLPEFYEIQFKFESYGGFSIINAWYEYTRLPRNLKI